MFQLCLIRGLRSLWLLRAQFLRTTDILVRRIELGGDLQGFPSYFGCGHGPRQASANSAFNFDVNHLNAESAEGRREKKMRAVCANPDRLQCKVTDITNNYSGLESLGKLRAFARNHPPDSISF